jgi:hypothetical protein
MLRMENRARAAILPVRDGPLRLAAIRLENGYHTRIGRNSEILPIGREADIIVIAAIDQKGRKMEVTPHNSILFTVDVGMTGGSRRGRGSRHRL